MRKCNNCDKLCPDSDKYCQTCGQATVELDALAREKTEAPAPAAASEPAYTPPAVPPVKNKKKGLLLGICGALVVLAAVAAIILLPKRGRLDPMSRFFAAQDEFITDDELAKKGLSIDSLMSGTYKPEVQNVSTDAELSFNIEGAEGVDKLSNISLLFQILKNGDDGLTGVQLRYNGTSLLSAIIDKSESGVGVYIPELSEKRYELSAELFSRLMYGTTEDGSGFDIKFDRVEDLKKSYEALKKDYLEIFYKGFAVEDFVQADGTVKLEYLGSDATACREITFTPNAERFSAMLGEMAARIKTDKALSDHLLSLMEHYYGKSGMSSMLRGFMLANPSETGFGENGLMPLLERIADSLDKDKEKAAKSLEDAKFTWRVITKHDEVIAQYLSWNEGENRMVFEKLDGKTAVRLIDGGKNLLAVDGTHKELDGGKKLESSYDITTQNVRLSVSCKDVDKEKKSALGIGYGSYEITIAAEDEKPVSIKAEVKEGENGGTDHRLVLEGVGEFLYGAYAEDQAPVRVTLLLHTTDKDSTVKKPDAEAVRVESEAQFEDVMEELSDKLTGIMAKLLMIFGSVS